MGKPEQLYFAIHQPGTQCWHYVYRQDLNQRVKDLARTNQINEVGILGPSSFSKLQAHLSDPTNADPSISYNVFPVKIQPNSQDPDRFDQYVFHAPPIVWKEMLNLPDIRERGFITIGGTEYWMFSITSQMTLAGNVPAAETFTVYETLDEARCAAQRLFDAFANQFVHSLPRTIPMEKKTIMPS